MMTPDHTYPPRTFTPQIYAERTFALKGLDGISDAQIEFDPSWLVIRCLAAVALVEIVGPPRHEHSLDRGQAGLYSP